MTMKRLYCLLIVLTAISCATFASEATQIDGAKVTSVEIASIYEKGNALFKANLSIC
jgi:hypothetical protein